MQGLIFAIYALAACGGAIGVVLSQNVVRMAFWLIISLGSVAGLFFLLNADFVGATQLLIYVGGTVVLLIFGVMLTASGPSLAIRSGPGEILLGSLGGLAVLGLLIFATLGMDWSGHQARMQQATGTVVSQESFRPAEEGQTVRKLGTAFLGLRLDSTAQADGNGVAGTGYLLPFEVISIHLLVVLVGASYLARTKLKRSRSTDQNS